MSVWACVCDNLFAMSYGSCLCVWLRFCTEVCVVSAQSVLSLLGSVSLSLSLFTQIQV